MMQSNTKIIGLTGNTGSGKGVTARLLEAEGGFIIDADKISHEIILKGEPAYYEILERLCQVYNIPAENILNSNGEIERKNLGAIVFEDDEKLQVLMNITHGYIKKRMLSMLENALKSKPPLPYIVMDAPLLTESGLDKMSDEVWLVYADKNTRLKRIMERDGLTMHQALLRMNSQRSFEELKNCASVVIENNGSVLELEQKVKKVLRR